MTPARLNVFFAFFPYAGNGGTSAEHPSIRTWFATTYTKCCHDPRIGEILWKDFSDTPITMTRNAAVLAARRAGCDVIVMCDSDNHPDREVGEDPTVKPFWDSSFDFLYERKMHGKATAIGAPYGGPPPVENCYIFRWASHESRHPADADMRLEMYSREEAAGMAGIHPAGALPTGLIMFDMRVFDVTDPTHEFAALLKAGHTRHMAEIMTRPWFYYEWTDLWHSEKASTEDVTCTRDIGLLFTEKEGYNPLYCNWDAWAGHYKPKCVRKPQVITADMVNEKYRQAILAGRESSERLCQVRPGREFVKQFASNGL